MNSTKQKELSDGVNPLTTFKGGAASGPEPQQGPTLITGGPLRQTGHASGRKSTATGRQMDRSKRTRRITDLARNTDNEQCPVCKKYYLKGRGIKIHQKKAGCYLKLDQHRKLDKSEA